MGFTQAALGREAARPKGALGALVGPCALCLREAEGSRVHLYLEPGPPDNGESFQVLRPGTQCQNLCLCLLTRKTFLMMPHFRQY